MTPLEALPADDACYLAVKARDARFDGCFFTGVTSTRIYCRPVCRVRVPKRENCRFFAHAAQAEQAGFRPCLRCRPELAPRAPALAHNPESRVWSVQDASSILAIQAARLLDTPEAWDPAAPTVEQLARRLGVSDRHLRRIFAAQFGVSPLQYLQTRRLLSAKQLLTDTPLAMAEVARLSGFASLRRFNAAFAQAYKLNPTGLRLRDTEIAEVPFFRHCEERSDAAIHCGATQGGGRGLPRYARNDERGVFGISCSLSGARPASSGRGASDPGIQVRLAYRPPYDVDAMLRFFQTRQVAGIEAVTRAPGQPCLCKTVAVQQHGQRYSGWMEARFDPQTSRVELRVSDSLREVLPWVMARVRAMLDLDADPHAINSLLHARFPLGDGLRVPGALDGFELAVRAVLGQQITVAAARTLAARLVQQLGELIDTPIAGLNRLFPTPAALASASGDVLGGLGIVKQRQAAIQAIANAVLDARLQLHAGADVPATLATLQSLPGVGDWTAQYIAMRALRWPDAFLAGDVALHKALGLAQAKNPAREAQAASQAWRPWRSYAVIRAWATLPAAQKTSRLIATQ